MIAYNKKSLDNLYIHEQVADAYFRNCVGKEEYDRCTEKYPVKFYTPNYLIRIGLFLLTVVIAVFSFGLILLISSAGSDASFAGLFIFLAIMAYVALEFMVHTNHHFKSGVDEALTWITGIALVSALNLWSDLSNLQNAVLIFLVSFYLALRFSNMFMSAAATIAFLAFIFFSYATMGATAKATAPFVLMLVSFFIYFLSSKNKNQPALKYYSICLLMIEFVALICLYAAGNYFIVREASIRIFHLDLRENDGIRFGWLFWISTFLVPIIYLARGIQKKDALLLRIGLLLIPAIVLTVRYYHHILPVEITMTLGGAFMIGCAYLLLKYLRQPKCGFTNEAPAEKKQGKIHQLEALAIAQTFGQAKPDPGNTTTTTFGGGSGGGSGAGSEF